MKILHLVAPARRARHAANGDSPRNSPRRFRISATRATSWRPRWARSGPPRTGTTAFAIPIPSSPTAHFAIVLDACHHGEDSRTLGEGRTIRCRLGPLLADRTARHDRQASLPTSGRRRSSRTEVGRTAGKVTREQATWRIWNDGSASIRIGSSCPARRWRRGREVLPREAGGQGSVIPGGTRPKPFGRMWTPRNFGHVRRPTSICFSSRTVGAPQEPDLLLDAFRTALESEESIRLVMAGEVRLIHTSRIGSRRRVGRQGEPPGAPRIGATPEVVRSIPKR